MTSFVGRRQDVSAVRQLASTTRLVTLTGIGGVGKTRLAFRVAAEVRRAFPDGVCVVELASLEDAALLPRTVIDALGIREQSSRAPMTVLCDYLRDKRMLLVLDNCEHLVAAVADLAHQVLRAAPEVRILATSRQALRIGGEHVYPVSPLPVPRPEVGLRSGTATQYPSVALLADRTAAAVPGFTLTPDTEAAVVRLCQRLEGIPLAIELASVRLRALTVDALVSRLDDRFALLRQGNRSLPERHQTLQAMIDWSYDLCTPAEQMLWTRASYFAGSFSTEGLEAVCTDDALPEDVLLDAVTGLLDKSIFIREQHGSDVRFHMLETLREYGQARLAASGDEPVIGRQHRDWNLRLIETASEEWIGPKQQEWASRLQLEHANLRRALEYCVSEPGEAWVGLRLAAVPWYWLTIGDLTEGKLWLDRALALNQEPSHERAWALATAAYLAVFQGDESSAATLLDEARDLAVRLDDRAALAFATHVTAARHFVGADLAGAIPLFASALEQYADAGVARLYPDFVRSDLASAHVLLGDVDKATEALDELSDRLEGSGEHWLLAYVLWGRSFVALRRGELDRAEADLGAAIKIKRFFHDTLGLALALDVLAWTTVAKGDAGRGAILLGGADTVWQTIGNPQVGSAELIAQRDKFEKMAREMMGDAEFDAAFERGSALTVEETLALALREHAHPASESPSPGPTPLTRREREIADLVAEGLSNKDIAARLVIAPRTAEAHVEHILTKLGFTKRTQIANWVLQQRVDGI